MMNRDRGEICKYAYFKSDIFGKVKRFASYHAYPRVPYAVSNLEELDSYLHP